MARKEVIQLRCSFEEKEQWRQAAEDRQMELSAWVRLMLNREAQNQLARLAADLNNH